MENSYTDNNAVCTLVKTKSEALRFILDYSKSMRIVKVSGISFENNMN